jgi:hypothetical protein
MRSRQALSMAGLPAPGGVKVLHANAFSPGLAGNRPPAGSTAAAVLSMVSVLQRWRDFRGRVHRGRCSLDKFPFSSVGAIAGGRVHRDRCPVTSLVLV